MSYYSKRSSNISVVFYLIALLVILVISLYRPINKASDIRTQTATVTDKGIKNKSNDSKYLVYCKDADGNVVVYEITDSLFYGRFNSSDTYAGIEIGKTYEFTIGGSRNEFLSWYPNIYRYDEIEEE